MHRLCIVDPARERGRGIFDQERSTPAPLPAVRIDPVRHFEVAGHPHRGRDTVIGCQADDIQAPNLVLAQRRFERRADEAGVDRLGHHKLVARVKIRHCVVVEVAARVVGMERRAWAARLVEEVDDQWLVVLLAELAEALEDGCYVGSDSWV